MTFFIPLGTFIAMGSNHLDGTEEYAADISSIREAYSRIKSVVHKTPVLSSETLNSMAGSGRKLMFKCECFQKG